MFSGGHNNDRYGPVPIPAWDAVSPMNPPADLRRSPRDGGGGGGERAPSRAGAGRTPRDQHAALDPNGYPTPPYAAGAVPPGYGYYPPPWPQSPYYPPPHLAPPGAPPGWPPAPPGWPPYAYGAPPPPGTPHTPYTPGHPPAGYPPHPGYQPTAGHRRTKPSMAEDYTLDRADKWSRPMDFRAPSIGIAEMGFLQPKAVEIHPLLAVPTNDKSGAAIIWNVGFPPSTAKKAGEEHDRALGMDDRTCPATWPLVKKMTIQIDDVNLARWEILVEGRQGGGVTVGDVLAAVSSQLHAHIHPEEWAAVNNSQSPHVRQYYKRIVSWANFNRSTDPRAPGGNMDASMERIDFLCASTVWGGLKVDGRPGRGLMRHAQSGYWVFKLELQTSEIGEASMPPVRGTPRAAAAVAAPAAT